MATPNTAILLSQLTQEATELQDQDFFLLDVAGVHKKISVDNLGVATEIWSVSPDNEEDIFYNAGNVGIGIDTPVAKLDIDAGANETAMNIYSSLGRQDVIQIVTPENSGDNNGVTFEVAGVAKWRIYYNESAIAADRFLIIEKVGLGTVIRVGAVGDPYIGFPLIKTVPGVVDELYNDSGNLMIT